MSQAWTLFKVSVKVKKLAQKAQEVAKFSYEEENEDHELLMVTSNSSEAKTNSWYLDNEYSNHMTRNRDPFTQLNDSIKLKVRFANNNIIYSKRII